MPQTSPLSGPRPPNTIAAACRDALTRAGCTTIALVQGRHGAWDVAFLNSNGLRILIRCMWRLRAAEMRELVNIALSADFDRIALLTDEPPSALSGLEAITIWPLNRFQECVAVLAAAAPVRAA